ncbi:MAG TPA: integration host factor, actinobacterial type [Arthrobacter sp.]|nr:integration host factor, actinobacterial type [Arthrobacter sp.]
MGLRPLTESERTAARLKATAARADRAEIKAKVKSGAMTVAEVIEAAGSMESIGRLRVAELLESLPGIGEVRAAAIMETVGIAHSRRLRGLGIHQRRALIDHLESQ